MLSSRTLWALLLVCLLALYWTGFDSPLMFDSTVALESNPEFHFDPSRFNEWRLAVLSSASGPTGRPISMLSFALNQALAGGSEAFWFKLGNLLLHGLVGTLIYLLLTCLRRTSTVWRRELGDSAAVPWLAAAIWLVHPLQVSSVLYSVQRMEQLSTLFILLGLLIWVRCRVRWLERPPAALDVSHCAVGILLSLLLAVYSKEDGVLLLPLLALVEAVFYRFEFAGRQRHAVRYALYGLIAAAALALVALVIWTPAWLSDWYRIREFTLGERLLTQSRVLWTYLGWIFVPDIRQYALHHDVLSLSSGLLEPVSTLLAVLAWAAVAVLLAAGWRRLPVFNFAIAWFLIAHALESSVVPLEMMYEHRNYLPLLGPALWFSWLVWKAVPLAGQRHRLTLAVVVLAALSLQTAHRAWIWSDEERLTAYHLRHHPTSPRSIYHYANTQLRLGEASADPASRREYLGRARRYYEHILKYRPRDIAALATLLYLDTRFFDLDSRARWKALLEEAVQKPVLGYADHNAMYFLLRCKLAGFCDMTDAEFLRLVGGLADRQEREPAWLDIMATFEARQRQDYAAAIALHESVLAMAPGNDKALQGLIAWYNLSGDKGATLEMMRQYLGSKGGVAPVLRVARMVKTGEER